MSATFGTYYYDGASFATSTGLFTDIDLTIPATAGTYRLGAIYRIWDGTSLSQAYSCDSCCQPVCAYTGPFTGVFDINTPDNYKDTICVNLSPNFGVVPIEFDFSSDPFKGFPMGFEVTYNGSTYVNSVSNRYGLITDRYTGSDEWISEGDFVAGSPYALTGRAWTPLSTTFESDGTSLQETVALTDVDFKANSPEKCYMVIPKPYAMPYELTVDIYSPRPITLSEAGRLSTTVGCPSGLAGFGSSATAVPLLADVCDEGIHSTMYQAQVNGAPSVPMLYDIIFTDPLGTTHPDTGYYHITGGRWIYIGVLGVVRAAGTGCRSGNILTEVISTPAAMNNPTSACSSTPSTTFYHDGVGMAPAFGDTLYSDSAGAVTIPSGFYQLQEEYIIIHVDAGGTIDQALTNCG